MAKNPTKNLTELKALVYDIQLKQKDLELEEGILNEPPDTAENIGSGQLKLTGVSKKLISKTDANSPKRLLLILKG